MSDKAAMSRATRLRETRPSDPDDISRLIEAAGVAGDEVTIIAV
jgi:hypothetical protein